MTVCLSRRGVLGVLAGAALPACAPVALPFFPRLGAPLGVQLYTVGEVARTDLEGTFRRLAGIGFRSVELAGFHGHDPSGLRAAADRAGLRLDSIHLPARGAGGDPGVDGDIPRLAATLRPLGITDVVVPMIDPPARLSAAAEAPFGERLLAALAADDWRRFAAFLNQRGELLAREGLKLGFHNHNTEFAPLGATSGWEILVAHTDPRLVSFELDVGWVAAAGRDPVQLLVRHADRVRQLHLKDILPSTKPNYALRQDPTEVGSGVVDWRRLLPAARAAGVRGYYVEQEPPFRAGPFEALARSHAFLTTRV